MVATLVIRNDQILFACMKILENKTYCWQVYSTEMNSYANCEFLSHKQLHESDKFINVMKISFNIVNFISKWW
jgi:hypothetical protein